MWISTKELNILKTITFKDILLIANSVPKWTTVKRS